MCVSYLVAVHHEVVCGDEGLEHHHPAVAGGPLQQGVGQEGHTHTQLVGAVDQVWGQEEHSFITADSQSD